MYYVGGQMDKMIMIEQTENAMSLWNDVIKQVKLWL
jgi:hypothetical protein